MPQPKRVWVRDETDANVAYPARVCIEVGVDDVAEIVWESGGITVLRRGGTWTWYPDSVVLAADGGPAPEGKVFEQAVEVEVPVEAETGG